MKRSSGDLVDEAMEHFRAARGHVVRFGLDDPAGRDAACLRLAVAIDCLTQLPPDLREAVCGEDWPSIRAMRNRIAHGYFGVAVDVVRDTAHGVDAPPARPTGPLSWGLGPAATPRTAPHGARLGRA